jgi:hypothetical protein
MKAVSYNTVIYLVIQINLCHSKYPLWNVVHVCCHVTFDWNTWYKSYFIISFNLSSMKMMHNSVSGDSLPLQLSSVLERASSGKALHLGCGEEVVEFGCFLSAKY